MGHQRSDIPIIVLAAGASSRMRGRDKLLESLDHEPLLRRQARMALNVTEGPVIIALPRKPHPRYDALAGLDAQLLPVPDAAEGMNASLRTAFTALPTGAKAAMVLLADMPELTEEDLMIVLQAVDIESDALIWRGCTSNGEAGHPIVFASDLFSEFAKLRGDGGGREVVAAAGDRVALIPLPGTRARTDLDTPEEWAAWRATLAD